jgi:hypothetical protein
MEYRRHVAMRCDGEDFVIAIQRDDEIVFPHQGGPRSPKSLPAPTLADCNRHHSVD